ncbi:oligopeptide ABC transporter substrate-binding protein [Lactobacillus sp. ESL0785]|uniref:oligopeptide ABC transporter substrate-binding protein n=1 Tax=Lactobacillus sp. ESL0785 TaxID=2983232 RepID=UPI0023F99C4C|nr:oligopeptide ABC transporter substrate-binding protein [Lactobacillus sp. ESL0785]WEV71168.1 oligopeptide ABC transporter substrate-binding protein [Lactobacillus sp. ESL0785]
MRLKQKLLLSTGLLAAASLTLTGCGKNNANTNQKVNKKFPEETPVKTAQQGGTLKVAEETDTPFTGIFADELKTTVVDEDVASPGEENLFDTDNHYKINDHGPATLRLNRKAKTATIAIKKGVRWSDGQQVVAKDMEYAYEILANKATQSQNYTSSYENILGMKEYHEGKTKTITGLEMPDGENGRRLVIHFKELKPGMLYSGNGFIWEKAEPYHYLKDVPFAKLQSSDKIRKSPMYFGAFKLKKLVRGQSVTWVPNKYYWRGKPKLNKIVISVVSTNSASQAIKSKVFDVTKVINSQWEQVKNTKGVDFVAKVPLSYYLVGFRVGKWDAQKGKNVMDPNAKMNNKALRQAIGYAMNTSAVYQRYTHGLSFHVPTLIPAQFGDYFDKNAKGYSYNLKKANELLDKAGYKKKGKWRVQPNGKPLTIHYMARQGDPTQNPIQQNYLQQWHKIGLNVKFLGGRLTEFNSYVNNLQNDSHAFDMFELGWSLDSEPSPSSLYSENAPMNYTRFVTKKNTDLLNAIDSEKAFNHKYRVQKFHEWQEYMNDEAYAIPEYNSYSVYAVNNKLTGYSLKPADNTSGHQLWYQVGFVK